MKCFATLFSFISSNTHARLPKNVYQLNELSGGISGLDSEHGTPTQISEVFGLIPKYLNKVAGHLSNFSSEFQKILALTFKKVWYNPPFSINFALNLPYLFISLIFKHCHTQNAMWCQGFEEKYSYFGQANTILNFQCTLFWWDFSVIALKGPVLWHLLISGDLTTPHKTGRAWSIKLIFWKSSFLAKFDQITKSGQSRRGSTIHDGLFWSIFSGSDS